MDDLLDLDFAAAKPTKQKQTAQSAYSSRTAFDYLAQQQQQRLPSPTPSSLSQPSRATTPLQPAKPQSKPQQSAGGDAFAELFGTSPGGGGAALNGGQGKQLSMQEKLQATKMAGLEAYGGAFSNGGISPISSTGAGGSRAASPLPAPMRASSPLSPSILTPTSVPSRSSTLSPSYVPPSAAASKKPSDPWDFDLLSSSVPAKSTSPAPADDPFDLGFDALPSASSSSFHSPAPPPPADDFDLLSAFSAPAAPSPPPSSAPSRAPPPSSARNGAASAVPSPPPHLLGSLVEMGFSPSAARNALVMTQNPDNKAWDMEAAVDVLMGGGGASAPPAARREAAPEVDEAERRRREKAKREADEWGDEEDVKIGRRRSWESEDDDRAEQRERDAAERRRRQAAELAASAPAVAAGAGAASSSKPAPRRRPAAQEDVRDDPLADPAAVLQQQATAALAQAQKLGFSAFKAAGSFWGQAKEAAVKAVEEQRAAARVAAGLPSAAGGAGGASSGEVKGKPKWWREGMDDPDAEEQPTNGAAKGKSRAEPSGFKDSDDEDAVLGPPPGSSRPRPQKQQQQPPPAPPAAAAEYRSPFRRAKAAPPPVAAAPEGDLLSGASSSAPPPSRSPAPAPTRQSAPPPSRSPAPSSRPRPSPSRPHIAVSPSALSTALSHKSTGNDHFKLGRFGDATAAYSLALEALPPKWIGRVPLLNNRAQSRLKSGEEKKAVDDCGEVLEILALSLPPSPSQISDADLLRALEAESSSPFPSEVAQLAGSTLDLRDHFGKALGRRAKASEAVEKWKQAGEDWERLLRIGEEVVLRGAGGRKLVGEGAVRCGKMLGGPPPSSSASTPSASRPAAARKPRPTATAASRPPPRPVQGSGDAVRALQASQAAALAEDDLRHSLKDAVEGKINAWKGGKETNLRALIASLEDVLWAELGWKKVGMHELISEGGLKVRYVRAIAKVHPDKLNVNNTTVEQRMIAGLVFAALNDAWNANK